MKRAKKLLLLSSSLVILCLLTFWLNSLNLNDLEEDTDTPATTIFSLDTDTITSLSWTYEEDTLTFTYDNGQWTYAEDDSFPVDRSILDNMASTLNDISSTKSILNVEDFSQYGLDAAACTISVTTDTTYEIQVGNETGLGSEYYLSIGDGNVYLVNSGFLDSFTYSLYDCLEEETIPTMSDIDSINIVTKTHTLELYHDKESTLTAEDGTAYFWFAKTEAGNIALDTTYVDSFVSTLTGLSFLECIDYKADADALAAYGLLDPIATATINYVETTEVDTGETDENGINIFEYEETIHTLVLEIGDYYDNYNYIRIQGSSMVYLIDASICDTILQTTYEALLPVEETEDAEGTT